jgi:hypothetical protein
LVVVFLLTVCSQHTRPWAAAEKAAEAAEAVEDELAEVLGMLDVGPMLAA